MNLEDLNNHQLILLSILTSFVTALGASLITASMLNPGTVSITQQINRVVERTVERVTPEDIKPYLPASALGTGSPTQSEKPVIITEGDLVAETVTALSPTQIPVYREVGGAYERVGLGQVLPGKQVLVPRSIGTEALYTRQSSVANSDEYVAMDMRTTGTYTVVYTLHASSTPKVALTKAISIPAVGQTIVILTGSSSGRIETGVVAETPTPTAVTTHIDLSTIPEGSLVATIKGNPVGLVLQKTIVPFANLIQK
jgi:hypothetical protein